MTSADFQHVKDILSDALDQEPDQRIAFVTQACKPHSAAIQAEVLDLLSYAKPADDAKFAETPVVDHLR